jgi:cytochrome c-type biogenesis protein CcmH/NrfF
MDKILELLYDIGDFIRFGPLFNLDEIILLGFLIMVLLLGVIYRFHKGKK